MKKNQKIKTIPNKKRAITNGKFATVYQGRRLIRYYQSGEPLQGELS
jgi:hypothetical protein